MLKKSITYIDYNGTERTEDFYFNLSKAELTEMEMTTEGGMSTYLEKIVRSQSQPEIVSVFKELVLKAYGEKSDDGRRFIKSKELSEAFSQTEAYSNLFMELAEDSEKAADFFNAIIPQDIPLDTTQQKILPGKAPIDVNNKPNS